MACRAQTEDFFRTHTSRRVQNISAEGSKELRDLHDFHMEAVWYDEDPGHHSEQLMEKDLSERGDQEPDGHSD